MRSYLRLDFDMVSRSFQTIMPRSLGLDRQRRRITVRGLHPVVPTAYRFASLYLYGAVQPTGQSFFLELPALTLKKRN